MAQLPNFCRASLTIANLSTLFGSLHAASFSPRAAMVRHIAFFVCIFLPALLPWLCFFILVFCQMALFSFGSSLRSTPKLPLSRQIPPQLFRARSEMHPARSPSGRTSMTKTRITLGGQTIVRPPAESNALLKSHLFFVFEQRRKTSRRGRWQRA